MREFEVLKKLNHKNIVKLFAIEEEVMNCCCDLRCVEITTVTVFCFTHKYRTYSYIFKEW